MADLHIHALSVKRHRVTCSDSTIIQHSMGHDAITLDLDDEWDGLSVALVIAGQSGDTYEVAYTGEPAIIPASLTEETGWLPVGVVGYGDDGKVRVLTAQASRLLRVEPSGPFDGGEPEPDPPDIMGQLLDARDAALQAAQAAEDAAAFIPDGGETGQVLTKTDDGSEWAYVQGGSGTGDYNQLSNKPSIDGVTVAGAADSLEVYGLKPMPADVINSICV